MSVLAVISILGLLLSTAMTTFDALGNGKASDLRSQMAKTIRNAQSVLDSGTRNVNKIVSAANAVISSLSQVRPYVDGYIMHKVDDAIFTANRQIERAQQTYDNTVKVVNAIKDDAANADTGKTGLVEFFNPDTHKAKSEQDIQASIDGMAKHIDQPLDKVSPTTSK